MTTQKRLRDAALDVVNEHRRLRTHVRDGDTLARAIDGLDAAMDDPRHAAAEFALGLMLDGVSYDDFRAMPVEDQVAVAEGNFGLTHEQLMAALRWMRDEQTRRAEALKLYARGRNSGISGVADGEQ